MVSGRQRNLNNEAHVNQSLRPPGARITRSRNQVTATYNAERLWPALRRAWGMGLWLGGMIARLRSRLSEALSGWVWVGGTV